MLDVRGLVVTYPGSPPFTAVAGIDLHVASGATVGLLGESGSGKSTAVRTIVGVTPAAAGEIRLDGADVTNARGDQLRALRREAQLVFQDPHASLSPRMTVGRAIQDGVAVATGQRIGARACRDEAVRLMGLVHLPGTSLDRYPHEFSGGQLQRIAVARALAARPRLLLLDEVTSALDVSVQATILNLLRELQAELGLSYLYVSHDLSVIRYLSERVYVMREGRIVEHGPTDAVFGDPQEEYTRDLLEAVPVLGRRALRR